MTPEEGKAIFGAARRHRESALLRMILTLGLRKGEALGLKLKDVDLESDPPTSPSCQRTRTKPYRKCWFLRQERWIEFWLVTDLGD
jgi:integrase